MPLQQPVQVHPVEVRLARGAADVALGPGEERREIRALEALDHALFGVLERELDIHPGGVVGARGRRDARRLAAVAERALALEDHLALHVVAQLAHVAGPV